MNTIGIIILIVLLAQFFLNMVSDMLNLKQLSETLPPSFRGLYSAQKYKKSQLYTQVKTRFGWLCSITGLIALFVVWFGRGFAALDEWARGFQFGPVATGLIFIGVLVFAKFLLDLPFSLYETFVIEEKFGFNNTSKSTFVWDRIKGMAIGILIGLPILSSILAFLEYAGAFAWLYCWILAVLFLLVMQYIVPKWIMPLFNRFDPIAEGELKDAILSYAHSIGITFENILVMDGSKRSGKSNAFFTGFGKQKRVVFFDTLIQQMSNRELVAVLAHEIGHLKKRHILFSLILAMMHIGLLFFLISFFISYEALFDAFYVNRPSVYAALVFFSILYSPIELFFTILLNFISRRNELQADRFSAETTRDASALINALKKLSMENLSNLSPHPFYVFLNYSHPPVIARIRALQSYPPNR